MMAKKGAGFRLWFRKLSIKRFHHSAAAAQRKRRSSSSSAPSGKDLGHGGRVISSPYHPLNSDSTHSTSSRRSDFRPPVITFSSNSSSPQSTFPAFSSSPGAWRHSFPALSPISHTSPCTSSTPAARRSPSKKLQGPQAIAAAVLQLSPINYKAIDLPFPASGGSSPAIFLQSPIFQAAPMASPAARILSPPLSSSAHSPIILFRSPLHPLSQQILPNPQSAEKFNAKEWNTTRSLDAASREAKMPAVFSSKSKLLASATRKSQATAACHTQAQCKERPFPSATRAQPMQIKARLTRESPLIVDCGCRPSLSSSFRKTKKTLQACGSCSSNNRGETPAHDRCYEQAMQKLRSMRDGMRFEESKTAPSSGCQGKPCILFSEEGHLRHSNEVPLKHKMLQQLRKRKKKSHLSTNEPPIKILSPPFSVHASALPYASNSKVSSGSVDGKIKSSISLKGGPLVFTDAQYTLGPWEKDQFSSFTSEDTFFSSFERSRPSFSSNSSSECFDKKLHHTNLGLSTISMPSNITETRKHTHSNHVSNTCNSLHAAALDQDAKSKPSESLIAVNFHSRPEDQDKGASKHGAIMAPICRVVPGERRMSVVNPKAGLKRGCVSPLVGIKEASCEEGNTSTTEQPHLGREGCTSSNVGFPNIQKKPSSSPDYVFSSHSDYYASARARPSKNVRAWKKSANINVAQDAVDDTGSARIRRRAQLQAKWMLREERIQWQSSVDESEVDGALGKLNANEDNAAHSFTKCVDKIVTSMERKALSTEVQSKHNTSQEAEDAGLLEPKLEASKEDSAGAAQTMLASTISSQECDVSKEENPLSPHTDNSFTKESRLMDSVAVVKSSRDPLVDFRDSMVDMIIDRQIYTAEDLGELLRCFLSLNPNEHHDTIVRAFMQVWARIFQAS